MRWILLPLLLLPAMAGHAHGDAPPWHVVIEKADTDRDGSVSMDEVKDFPNTRDFLGFQAFMADHFVAFDLDNDGILSELELHEGIARIGMSDQQVYEGFLHGFAFMSVR